MSLVFQAYLEGSEVGFTGIDTIVYYTAYTLSGLVLNIYVDVASGTIADAFIHEPID